MGCGELASEESHANNEEYRIMLTKILSRDMVYVTVAVEPALK